MYYYIGFWCSICRPIMNAAGIILKMSNLYGENVGLKLVFMWLCRGFVLERQTMTNICASLKAQGNDLLPTGWKLLDTAIANEITFDAAKKLPYYQLVLVHEHDAFG